MLGLALVVITSLACESRVSIGRRCTNDDECGELSCRFGRCRAECARASECSGRGAVCVGEPGLGVCTIPSVDTCAGGCESGLVCADEVCSTACETSVECLSGSVCEPTSGACVADGEIADAGTPDGGTPDAGTPDAGGRPDAGPLPATTLRTVCTGSAHVCATDGGVVYCWGRNNAGQLGDGPDDFNPSTHITCPDGADCSPTPRAVQQATGDLGDVIELACGENHTAALTRGGRVYTWGSVGDGGLGGPSRGGHIAVEVAGLTGVDHIIGGRYHTCARIGSSYRCWGHNATMEGTTILDDRLGSDTTMIEGAAPLAAPAWEGAIDLALGGYYTCALFATGVECRGTNESGVTGETTSFGEPVTRNASVTPTAGATAIGSGVLHACVLIDGAPWCWGGGDHGELGPSPIPCMGALSSNCSGTPQRIPDRRVRSYTFLSHGYGEGNCVISTEGQIVCWGTNGSGSSGGSDPSEDIGTLDEPITHAGVALIGMVEVARAAGTGCARSDMGTVFCWGAHESGQLGCSNGMAPDLLPHPVACDVAFP